MIEGSAERAAMWPSRETCDRLGIPHDGRCVALDADGNMAGYVVPVGTDGMPSASAQDDPHGVKRISEGIAAVAWSADWLTKDHAVRYGCWCATESRPCQYHEGFNDGIQAAECG